MLYCDRCMRVCPDGECEGCGRQGKKLRESKPHEPCFLCETDFLTAGLIEGALEENKIPFFKRNDGGAAISIIVGSTHESDRLYVPFRAYDMAKEIADGILSESEGEEFELEIGDQWMTDGKSDE